MTLSPIDLNHGQRPFWIRNETDPPHIYALGVELDAGALIVSPDPYTCYCRFQAFPSPADALVWLRREVGPRTPLVLAWDERPLDWDVPFSEEEVPFVKPAASWRPAVLSQLSESGRFLEVPVAEIH
jgi:hypothetical protein